MHIAKMIPMRDYTDYEPLESVSLPNDIPDETEISSRELPVTAKKRRDKLLLLCILSWMVSTPVVVLFLYEKATATGESYEAGWQTDFGMRSSNPRVPKNNPCLPASPLISHGARSYRDRTKSLHWSSIDQEGWNFGHSSSGSRALYGCSKS